jgi:hypothetical protein
MSDRRCEWGQANSGWVFHRAVTALMVKWVAKTLHDDWLPTIECTTTRQWMTDRLRMGLDGTKHVPAFVHAFLDDTWVYLAGTTADIERARKLIMAAFECSGFILSASKLLTEGIPDTEAVILGHHLDMMTGTIGVTEYKRVRIKDQVDEMRKTPNWNRRQLESLLGLIQSTRGDVRRRWRLDQLCALLRRKGMHNCAGLVLKPTARAMKALERVVSTLHERRLLTATPTRWVMPIAPTSIGIVNTDASSLEGWGGALLFLEEAQYFSGKWSDVIRAGRMEDGERKPIIDIAVLEALTVIVAAATWGNLWSGKKIVMRSDSSPACYCFNKQSSKDPAMARVVDLWENIQHYFGFEGLMIHCKGEWNEIADRASRWDEDVVQAGVEEAVREEELGVQVCTRIDPKWAFGGDTVDIIDDLIALTAAAVAARIDATITNPASPNILAHPPPQIVQLRKTPDHGKDTALRDKSTRYLYR